MINFLYNKNVIIQRLYLLFSDNEWNSIIKTQFRYAISLNELKNAKVTQWNMSSEICPGFSEQDDVGSNKWPSLMMM
jgi:hypothetical protein